MNNTRQVKHADNTKIAYAPLIGFESDCEKIDLGTVSIRHLSEKELEALWRTRKIIFPSMMGEFDFMAVKYCLWAEVTNVSPIQTFNLVVKSLRLWKEGAVGYNKFFLLPRHGRIGGECSTYSSIWGLGQPKFVLKSGEVEDFISFFHKLEAVQTKIDVLDIALSRLGYSYERNRADDRLIDLMIAFESLFCEGPGDLTHKLSTRVARFLEQDSEKRKKLGDFIREAYVIRNNVVHGNKQIGRHAFLLDRPEKTKLNPHEYLPIIETYLRRSLRLLIDKAHVGGEKLNKEIILDEIDFGKRKMT
jgi:hypothetical protein